jgi:very-short-patch-repair endonuclease
MNYLYNNQLHKVKRRNLRKNSTDAERILWSRLKNKQCHGLRFLRQYSVGSYIIDIFCPKLRLAIEIDGGQHNNLHNSIYDQQRSEYLAKNNIKVIRFWNNEVFENLDGVYEIILKYCSTF